MMTESSTDAEALRYSTLPWANQMKVNMLSGLYLQEVGGLMNQSVQNKPSNTQLARGSHSTRYLKNLQLNRKTLSVTSSLLWKKCLLMDTQKALPTHLTTGQRSPALYLQKTTHLSPAIRKRQQAQETLL